MNEKRFRYTFIAYGPSSAAQKALEAAGFKVTAMEVCMPKFNPKCPTCKTPSAGFIDWNYDADSYAIEAGITCKKCGTEWMLEGDLDECATQVGEDLDTCKASVAPTDCDGA